MASGNTATGEMYEGRRRTSVAESAPLQDVAGRDIECSEWRSLKETKETDDRQASSTSRQSGLGGFPLDGYGADGPRSGIPVAYRLMATSPFIVLLCSEILSAYIVERK